MATNFDHTFKTLEQIAAGDEPETGGKAFNCARLRQAGFAVPPGLVVLAGATASDIERVADHPWMDSHSPGTRFAVRSSGIGEDGAGHSFAGVHETLLNVEPADIPEAVKRCRRSVHSEQAASYRRSRQIIEAGGRTGVLIQPMIAALTSGVAFTVNPVNGANELVINAAPGLGDALVSGIIDPDELHVDKDTGAILSTHPGTRDGRGSGQLVLDAPSVAQLAQVTRRIERFFKAPQDIEWCHDGQQFWILQSRPVTTAASIDAADIEWTRANLAEVFPDQTSPQALTVYEDMLNRSELQFMGRLLDPRLGPMVKNFHGRLYFNLTQLRHVCRLGGSAPAGVLRSLGHTGTILPSDEVRIRPRLREVLPRLPDFIRLARNDCRAPRLMRRQERAVEEIIRRLASANLNELPDTAIWSEIENWLRTAPDFVQLVLLLGSVLFDEEILRSACRRVGASYEALVYPLLGAGERSVSTQQAFDLVALADVARQDPVAARYFTSTAGTFDGFRDALRGTPFLAAFDRFIEEYGHRGHYETDWALPRYREEPTPILFAVQIHLGEGRRDDLAATSRRLEREAADAWRAFEGQATWWQRITLLPRVRRTIRRLKRRYLMREKARSDLTRVLVEMRRRHLALAERFVSRGWLARRDDYFLLHFQEIGRAVNNPAAGPGLKAIARARMEQMADERQMRMPLLMRESALTSMLRRGNPGRGMEATTLNGRLTGLCVSPGCVDGEVVVILDPRHFQQMRRGAILVAPATDPSWTPLFTLASGIIVEVGGMLSHASTVARQYGLPALANVKDATRRLHTGERVRLDATRGFIALYDPQSTVPTGERAGML